MVQGFTICFMSYSSSHAWQHNFSISGAADVNVRAWGGGGGLSSQRAPRPLKQAGGSPENSGRAQN